MRWTRERKIDAALRAPRVRALLRSDTRVVERPGWFQIVTPSAPTFMNEVTYAQLDEAECERVIDETIATYRTLGIRTRWYVGPDSAPSDLGDRLARRGFTRDDYLAMCIETSARIAVPDAVTTAGVDAANLDEYLRVQHEGWSRLPGQLELDRPAHLEALARTPRLQLFLASVGGEPVGTGASIVCTDDHGYLLGGQVLERARGRGAYKALVAARLEALRAGGQEYAVTNAHPKTSAPILTHLGFETLFSTAAYTLPAYDR